MGLPVYVVNFDELISGITVSGVTVQVDTSGIEAILSQYFPELIELLSRPPDLTIDGGVSKIKGFSTTGESVVYTPASAIALTGVSFSQNNFDDSNLDTWTLTVRNGGAEIRLLDGVFAKDALQQKYFEKPYPVPAGYEIVMTPGGTDSGKIFWFDLEYREAIG